MSRPGPTPTVTDDEIIRAVKTHELPVVDAERVASQVDISRERARLRLNRLAETGPVERATLNKNSVVYWVTR